MAAERKPASRRSGESTPSGRSAESTPSGRSADSTPRGGADAIPPVHRLVLARRTRPRRFSELIGQSGIAAALESALRTGKTAHAYLFSGPRGTGKTTTARLVAMSLNCLDGSREDASPCGACESCQRVHEGRDVDVLEIDAASNRGIDPIRELREQVHYRPLRAKHRIFIVDEVHQLTDAAFNALLKTLEEPPSHVVFVLATTNPSKVPDTIRSRCLHFHFHAIPETLIRERLEALAREEGRTVEPSAVEAIARRSGGSLRDALSLLDQLLALPAETLTAADLDAVTGRPDPATIEGFLEEAIRGDAPALLRRALGALRRGIDAADLLDELLARVRALLLVKTLGKDVEFVSATIEERERLERQSEAIDHDGWIHVLDAVLEERERLHRLPDAEDLVVEHACHRLLALARKRGADPRPPGRGDVAPRPSGAAGAPRGPRDGGGGPSGGEPPAAGRTGATPADAVRGRPGDGERKKGGGEAAPGATESRNSEAIVPFDRAAFDRFVALLVERMPSLGSLLKKAVRDVRFAASEVTLETSEAPEYVRSRFEEPRAVPVVRAASIEAFGRGASFRFAASARPPESRVFGADSTRGEAPGGIERVRDMFGGEWIGREEAP